MTVLSFIQDKLAAYAAKHPAQNCSSVAVSAVQTTSAEALRYIVGELSAVGIKANYDPTTAEENRILLHSARANTRNYELAQECNGIIIDYQTWQVLYRPTLLPNAKFSVKRVQENFQAYRVFPLRDGTVVGLYHYQGRWRICTARGLDMGRVSWQGVSYQDAVEAAMASTAQSAGVNGDTGSPRAAYPGLKWDDLDEDASYTVGFTHPQMHYTQELALWLIRIAVTATGVELSLSTFDEIDTQAPIEVFSSFKEVQAACADAEATSWGYMLRGGPEKCGADATILLESRKMMLVRTLVYDRSQQSEADVLGITLPQYTFCQSLCDASQSENYTAIFPERRELQAAALASIHEMAAQIVQAAQDGSSKRLAMTTAGWFYHHIAQKSKIQDMTERQIEDFILSRKSLSVVVQHLVQATLLP